MRRLQMNDLVHRVSSQERRVGDDLEPSPLGKVFSSRTR